MMNSCMKRRAFFRRTAQGAAGFLILRNASSARTAQANGRVHVALVGVGGRGQWFVQTLPNLARVVALCDVNDQNAAKAAERIPTVPVFRDFRVMLDKMGREIDAVVIATPDHTHAVACAAAIRAGRHVFVEKPMTRTVHEARALRELARTRKVATSMGNQGTASGPFRRAVEIIRGGAIGAVKTVHTWNDQGGPAHRAPPEGDTKVPPYLDWDLWLGPARARPFHPRWLGWHGWRDFGTGNLGNWASHSQNLAFMALKVDALWRSAGGAGPKGVVGVEAKTGESNALSFPKWEHVRWDIPPREGLPAVSFHWHNGRGAQEARAEIESMLGRELDWGDKGEKKWADWAGCLIVGSGGLIHTTAHNATFLMLPAEKFKDLEQETPEKLGRSRGHERDWLEACAGGAPAWASFDYAGPLTEFNMLGNVATRFEGRLEYDPVAGRIANHAEADRALKPEYREGWAL